MKTRILLALALVGTPQVGTAAASPKRPNVIVVITDGHEGCGGDPCAAAQDLKRMFPSVKVHVIDVVGISRLQCVADITGGTTVGARDTEQLKAAVRRTQAAIEQDACR